MSDNSVHDLMDQKINPLNLYFRGFVKSMLKNLTYGRVGANPDGKASSSLFEIAGDPNMA